MSADGQAVVRDMSEPERQGVAGARGDDWNEDYWNEDYWNEDYAYNGGINPGTPLVDFLGSADDTLAMVLNREQGTFAILDSPGDLLLQDGVKLDGLEITGNASGSTVTLEGGAQATNVAVNGDNVTLNVQERAKVDNVLVNGSGTILDVDGEVSNVYKTGDQTVDIEGDGANGAVLNADTGDQTVDIEGDGAMARF